MWGALCVLLRKIKIERLARQPLRLAKVRFVLMIRIRARSARDVVKVSLPRAQRPQTFRIVYLSDQ